MENREDLLIRVATLYYEEDHNQQQIANMLNISRSNISRLLKEAKQKGLVEIRIRKRVDTVPEIERDLKQYFGLRAAMVINGQGRDYAERLATAGEAAAQYLELVLRPHDVLAVAWGTGVSAAVSAVSSDQSLGIDVVQMLGSVGTVDTVIDGPELSRQLATKLGGQFYYLPAPLFVDSPEARALFLEQQTVADTLERARNANIALAGIGTTQSEMSSFLRAKHLTEEQLEALRSQGAVGETCGIHFDIEGNTDQFGINKRVICLDVEDQNNIPIVVAVACGLPKTLSILGALRGGHINAIATDDITAAAVLEKARELDIMQLGQHS